MRVLSLQVLISGQVNVFFPPVLLVIKVSILVDGILNSKPNFEPVIQKEKYSGPYTSDQGTALVDVVN